MPLHFKRTYNSLSLVWSPLGYGWSHTYSTWLSIEPPDGPRVFLYAPDGAVFGFTRQPDGTYASPPGIHRVLKHEADGTWMLRFSDGLLHQFDGVGRLQAVVDRHGNQVWLTYDLNGNLSTITDGAGRTITLTCDPFTRYITAATDPLGRAVTYHHDGNGDLIAVDYPDGGKASYTYTYHQMTSHSDDRALSGMAATAYTYDGVGRVSHIDLPGGLAQSFGYDAIARRTVFTDTNGQARVLLYDAAMNPIAITDALGGVTTYAYDANHHITAVTDPNAHTRHYAYDGAGLITAITDALGSTSSYAYEPTFGRLTQATDPLGRITSYTYDGTGNLLTVTDANGGVTSYSYDGGCCQPTVITDANGHATVYVYDGYGNPATVTDPSGATTTYTHDLAGRRLSQTDALGRTTSYTYDAADRVLTESGPLGGITSYNYDLRGNLTQETDPRGIVTRYEYDNLDRLVREIENYHDGPDGAALADVNVTTAYGYDALGSMVAITDPLGIVTCYECDHLGRRTAEILNCLPAALADDHTNVRSAFGYDAVGNRLWITDAHGIVTCYEYDAANQPITVTENFVPGAQQSGAGGPTDHQTNVRTVLAYDAVGNTLAISDALGRVTRFGYDGLDHLVAITDPLGGVTAYGYDAVGNQSWITDALGIVTRAEFSAADRLIALTSNYDPILPADSDTNVHTTFAYDAVGNGLAVTDPLGRVTTYSYDALNRTTVITDAAAYTVTYGYDAVGNTVALTDTQGQPLRYGYDALGRLTVVTDALGNPTLYSYDAAGHVLSVSDAAGHSVNYTYDPLGRIVAVTDAAGETRRYGYDALGQTRTITDARGSATSYSYDPLGRLLSEVYADGTQKQYGYDAVGNVVRVTDANGTTVDYAYDVLEQPTDVTVARGPGVGGTTFVSYVYDALGRMTEAQDDDSLVSWTYDALDRSLTDIQDGAAVSYEYDAAGGRRRLTWPNGRFLTFEPDALNRLGTIRDPGGQLIAHYDWLSQDRMGQRVYGNGVTTTFTYDAVWRPVEWHHQQADGSTIARFAYGYDAAHNQLYQIRQTGPDPAPGDVYEYDEINQLIHVKYGVADPLAEILVPGSQVFQSEAIYDLDAEGNRVQVHDGSGGTQGYVANAMNEYETVDGLSLWYDHNGNLVRLAAVVSGTVALAGDMDGDCDVDIVDIMLVASHWGSVLGDPTYDSGFDLDGDGDIDIVDIMRVAVHWGETCSIPAPGYGEALYAPITTQTSDATSQLAVSSAVTGAGGVNGDTAFHAMVSGRFTNRPYALRFGDACASTATVVTDTVVTYQYDYRNQLIASARAMTVTVGGSVWSTDVTTVTFAYDAVGRRIAKSTAVGTLRCLYDGEQVIEERDEAGTIIAQYIYGSGIDELLRQDRGGQTYWFHDDALGSVTHVTDNAGQLLESYTYDAYGQPAVWDATGQRLPGTAIGTARLFTGREYDAETGLYYYRSRYYDPRLGRFLQRDPLGSVLGMNLYTYVENNPARWTDPYGLCKVNVKVSVRWSVWKKPRRGRVGKQFGVACWGGIGECQATCDVIKDSCPGKCHKAVCREVTLTVIAYAAYVKGNREVAVHEATHVDQMRRAAEAALKGLDYQGACTSQSEEKLKKKCREALCKSAKQAAEKARKDWNKERAQYVDGYGRYRQDPAEVEAFEKQKTGVFPPGVTPPKEFK